MRVEKKGTEAHREEGHREKPLTLTRAVDEVIGEEE